MSRSGQASSWDGRLQEIRSAVGSAIGTTEWFSLSQLEVDLYGALVEDLDPMHNDPQWQDGIEHWGGTIVIGTNVLGMLPRFLADAGLPALDADVEFTLEDLSRVRFIAPLPVGHRARARVVLNELVQRDGTWYATTEVVVEREGEERPFMSAASTSSFRERGVTS